MAGYAVIGAMIFLFVSDAIYRAIVRRVKPLFPATMREEREAHYFLGAVIWEPFFPNELRRKYLWSIGFAALAALCVVLVADSTGHPYWAVFFACLLLGVIRQGAVGWTKYRKRL
jgi:hypothetical protein